MNHLPATPAVDTAPARPREPLVFGGIPEAEGWALAPIAPRDRVHFRTDRELPLEEFRRELPDGVTVSYDQGEACTASTAPAAPPPCSPSG